MDASSLINQITWTNDPSQQAATWTNNISLINQIYQAWSGLPTLYIAQDTEPTLQDWLAVEAGLDPRQDLIWLKNNSIEGVYRYINNVLLQMGATNRLGTNSLYVWIPTNTTSMLGGTLNTDLYKFNINLTTKAAVYLNLNIVCPNTWVAAGGGLSLDRNLRLRTRVNGTTINTYEYYAPVSSYYTMFESIQSAEQSPVINGRFFLGTFNKGYYEFAVRVGSLTKDVDSMVVASPANLIKKGFNTTFAGMSSAYWSIIPEGLLKPQLIEVYGVE